MATEFSRPDTSPHLQESIKFWVGVLRRCLCTCRDGVAQFRVVLIAGMLVGMNAAAQDYPARLIKIVVPAAAGTPVDVSARIIAQSLSDSWKQAVVVENRVGASEIIGTEVVSKAPPDGYTLLIAANPFTVNPAIFAKLPYDPVRGFTPVTMISQTPMLLVASTSAQFSTVKELVAAAKARPGALSWSSAGMGTMNHITGEQFAVQSGIKILHVPYKDGSPAAANAVLAGDTQFGVVALNSALPFIKSGRLRALAITTERRSSLAPELPTLAELGFPGVDAAVRTGLYAPAGTPGNVIVKLNEEVNRIIRLPSTREKFAALGADGYGTMSAQAHEAFVRKIAGEIAKTVAQANIKVD